MGFQELRQKLIEKMRQQQEEFKAAQAISQARDDFTTTDNGLRNTRRFVQKYRDRDEKEQLQAYLRMRQAQEDKSWLNPYGMLDNQEINISREHTNAFANAFNPYKKNISNDKPVSVLSVPNTIRTTKNVTQKKSKRRRYKK